MCVPSSNENRHVPVGLYELAAVEQRFKWPEVIDLKYGTKGTKERRTYQGHIC